LASEASNAYLTTIASLQLYQTLLANHSSAPPPVASRRRFGMFVVLLYGKVNIFISKLRGKQRKKKKGSGKIQMLLQGRQTLRATKTAKDC
jgi:hypothetical protein